jgi:putative aldouronate transport system permease protein
MRVYTIPKGFDLTAYKVLFTDSNMWKAYVNTFLYVIPTTILMIITSTLVAYGLNYRNLIGRKYLTMFLLIPMYFSGGMIPTFLLVVKLGIYDNPLSQIIPVCFSIWNIILVKAYFRTIPDSLSEAAKMDGAGLLQILYNIYLPLGKPIFAVLAVYTIVGVWNSWFNAMLYLPHTDWQPLQMYLRRILIEATKTLSQNVDPAAAKLLAMKQLSNVQMKYAIIIFTSLPVLCTYPFFQKYFVKGMVLGSLKE